MTDLTQAYLDKHSISYKAVLLHKGALADNWTHDLWAVCLSRVNKTFQVFYKIGVGNRDKGTPQKPEVSDVLEILCSDADVLYESRSEWLDKYAMGMCPCVAVKFYEKCLTQAQDLQNFLPTSIQQLTETFDD